MWQRVRSVAECGNTKNVEKEKKKDLKLEAPRRGVRGGEETVGTNSPLAKEKGSGRKGIRSRAF